MTCDTLFALADPHSCMKIAGLTSDRGQVLTTIADREPGGATLAVVLTDADEAAVLDRAAERGVPAETVPRSDDAPRDHERRVLATLASYEVDLVCLDGYGPDLSEAFFESAPTTLDSHPSLLPAFPGEDPCRAALDAGVSVTGSTVRVAGRDSAIVTQEPVPVYGDDTRERLDRRVRREGRPRAFLRAVRAFAEGRVELGDDGVDVDGDTGGQFPTRRVTGHDRVTELRYGENPHQDAALYADPTAGPTVVTAPQRNPGAKAMSYNNYNDADAALGLVREFEKPAAAVIKHTNPAGCATASSLSEAYERALATDPMSAFGGIVALNRTCDEATATAIVDSFKEVVLAPGYTDDALDVLSGKDNLRVLDVGGFDAVSPGAPPLVETDLAGGRLVQERDDQRLAREELSVVTDREPTDAQVETMLFAWQTLKHVRSNGILLAAGTETVGVGMGQVSRVDAVRLAAMKAAEHAEGKGPEGSVLASDAFFPFPDGIEHAAEAGVEAVVQPGGSKNDDAVIAAADELGLAMAFTGQRSFRHG